MSRLVLRTALPDSPEAAAALARLAAAQDKLDRAKADVANGFAKAQAALDKARAEAAPRLGRPRQHPRAVDHRNRMGLDGHPVRDEARR